MTLHSGAAKPHSVQTSSSAPFNIDPPPQPKTRNNSLSYFPPSSPSESLPASLLSQSRKFNPSPRLDRDGVFRRPLPPTPERPRGAGRSNPPPTTHMYSNFDECLSRMLRPEAAIVHSPKSGRKQHPVLESVSGKRHSLPSLKRIFIRHNSASHLDPSAR